MSAPMTCQLVCREMMHLTGVKRAVCIRAWDVVNDEWLYRWHGGGKGVVIRLPHNATHIDFDTAVDRWFAPAVEMWRQQPVEEMDQEAVYERLFTSACRAGMTACIESLE